MPRTDIGDTLEARRFDSFSYTIGGTLAAGDVLGDTTNGVGLPLPASFAGTLHYNAGTASGTGTDIVVHNLTQGTSATFTPGSASGTAAVDLDFDEGDELAIEVAAVDGTTAGANVGLALELEQDNIV